MDTGKRTNMNDREKIKIAQKRIKGKENIATESTKEIKKNS
jgi:hypothetical protein